MQCKQCLGSSNVPGRLSKAAYVQEAGRFLQRLRGKRFLRKHVVSFYRVKSVHAMSAEKLPLINHIFSEHVLYLTRSRTGELALVFRDLLFFQISSHGDFIRLVLIYDGGPKLRLDMRNVCIV